MLSLAVTALATGDFSGHLLFQHVGTVSHFHFAMRPFLDSQLPESWLGCGGPTLWPPRSPDVSHFVFFFWGFVKNFAYRQTNATSLARAISPNHRCDCSANMGVILLSLKHLSCNMWYVYWTHVNKT
jgi:hypothetical protein